MPAATRKDDCCTGHDACAPVPLVGCSSNVFTNGRGAGRVGDQYSTHSCVVHPGHQDAIVAGSGTVFINSIPAARKGDSVSLAGSVRDGSANVFIGG